MRKRWLRASLPGVLAGFMVGSLALGGCTRSGPADVAQVVADPVMHALLQHVPADTPYAFIGMGGGGTRDFVTKIYAPLAPLMTQLEEKLASPELQAELGISDSNYALLRAVLDELKGKFSVDGMAELGFDVDARFAIYGLGVLPAMRLQLRDPAALRAALERIQAKSGTHFQVSKFGEVEYWPVVAEGYEGAVAILGDQLVVGVAPAALRDRVFALLLGAERPAQHLGGSERFQKLLADHGLAKISAGYFDARILAEAFLGEGDPLNKDTLAAVAPDIAGKWPNLDETCKQEYRSLVALAPRMVFGTEQIDGTGFAGKFVLELRPDVAQELMTMRASMPGIDSEHTGAAMFALGGGFDMERALAFVHNKAATVQATPYACADLRDLNNAAAEVGAQLKQIPGPLQKARGFVFVAEDVKLSGFMPTDVRGYGVAATGDTEGLLGLMRMVPPFTTQALTADGTVHTIADGTIPFLTNVSYGVQAGLGAVFAAGNGSKERVGELLAAPPQADPPLMVVVYDLGRMGELMDQATTALSVKPPEMQTLINFYKSAGSVVYDIRASELGLVMNTRMTLR